MHRASYQAWRPAKPPIGRLHADASLEAVVATTPEEILAARTLRDRVSSDCLLEGRSGSDRPIGLDAFDASSDHLIVRCRDDHRVVATCRILGPRQAEQLGRFWCEDAFDLGTLAGVRAGLYEFSRVCVDPSADQAVVGARLWSALDGYLERRGCGHILGCVDVPTVDGGLSAAGAYRALAANHGADGYLIVTPRRALPVERLSVKGITVLPPLLTQYLRRGGMIAGTPHWDTHGQCARIPVLSIVLRPLCRPC